MNYKLHQAFLILGVASEASEKDVRKAYARLAKATRPDTDPDGFTRIRDAYEQALHHVKSTVERNEPETNSKPSLERSANEQSSIGVSLSDSDLSGLLSRAPGFDEKNSVRENRIEQLNQQIYGEFQYDKDRVDDHEIGTNEQPAEEIITTETFAPEEQTAPSDNDLETFDSSRSQYREADPKDSINPPISNMPENGVISSPEDDAFVQESVFKIQQLLDRSEGFLRKQNAYNAQIDSDLVAITDEVVALSAELQISARDDALEKLAKQIIDHSSAPFGFVAKVADHLELADTVLPKYAPFWKAGLQERFYSMRDVYNFEKRSHGRDYLIAYFIHGRPKPFRFTGFPNKRDIKLYQTYANMLLSSWPSRPDLIHPKAQRIIDKVDSIKVDDFDENPDTSFDTQQLLFFVRVVVWIVCIGFAINLLSGRVTSTAKKDLLEDMLNPSDEVKSRVEAIRARRLLEQDDTKSVNDIDSIQQQLEELAR